jgi:hypothetical protein
MSEEESKSSSGSESNDTDPVDTKNNTVDKTEKVNGEVSYRTIIQLISLEIFYQAYDYRIQRYYSLTIQDIL